MKKSILFWLPRILVIGYILFISIFSLDAFYGENSFWQELGSFFKHLIPSIVLSILLLISWKRDFTAGMIFLVSGLLLTFLYSTFRSVPSFVCLSCPLYLAGLLFLISYALKYKDKASA